MTHPTDRNLLVGILALQMDFVSREQLIAAMNAWVLQKSQPLEQILHDHKALSSDTVALLQALVSKHLELHGNDAHQSLQSLSSIGALRDELQSLADPEVHATLTHVARQPESGEFCRECRTPTRIAKVRLGDAIPHNTAARQRRARRSIRRPRHRTQSRSGAQGNPGTLCRAPGEPLAVLT